MYIAKKTIKGKNYYYLIKEVRLNRLKNKKKKFQLYLGRNIENKEKIEDKKKELEKKIIESFKKNSNNINKKEETEKELLYKLSKQEFYKKIFFNEIIKNLKSIFKENLISIILFGSYAKNMEKEESDIDLLVVCNNLPNINKRQDLIKTFQNKFLIEKNKKLSFILITKDELIDWIKNENPLLYGLITGYEYLYDKDNFFRNKIVIFKNKMKVSNITYIENYEKIPLADII